MKKSLLSLLFLFSFLFSSAQITVQSSFNPPVISGLCGIGYYPGSSVVWVYDCSNAEVNSYDTTGVLLSSFPTPGGAANDVDIEIAPIQFLMNGNVVPEGQILFINGESGEAEIYSVDSATGIIADTLNTVFGDGHVVGGAYHHQRNTFFVVQDNVPSVQFENLIAEIDPLNGDTLATFQISAYFNVSFGDLEVGANGNLYVVSSAEDSIAEFTPGGLFVQMHALPPTVNNLSGIALDCATSQAWVCTTSGEVFRLGNFPCGTTTVHEEDEFLKLSNPFPNPFSNEINFSIFTKQQEQLKISLIDISGRKVKEIYNEVTTSGITYFTLNENLSRGVYFLNAESNNYSVRKKIVCIN